MLPAQLSACLKQLMKIINFVKASALNTQLFKQLCEDLGSEHTSLLYHTEVVGFLAGMLLNVCSNKGRDAIAF